MILHKHIFIIALLCTPLFAQCSDDTSEKVSGLAGTTISLDSFVNTRTKLELASDFSAALRKKDFTRAQQLINAGADVRERFGKTPLLQAVDAGEYSLVNTILNTGTLELDQVAQAQAYYEICKTGPDSVLSDFQNYPFKWLRIQSLKHEIRQAKSDTSAKFNAERLAKVETLLKGLPALAIKRLLPEIDCQENPAAQQIAALMYAIHMKPKHDKDAETKEQDSLVRKIAELC